MCDRNQVYNDRTDRCKACGSFTVSDLKSMARRQGRNSSFNSKQMLCDELTRGRRQSRGRSSSRTQSRGRSSRRTQSRDRSRSRTQSRSRSRGRGQRSRTQSRGRSRSQSRGRSHGRSQSRSVSSRTSRAARQRRTERGTLATYARALGYGTPRSGTGSYQARHFSSTRQGPPLPAQAYCGSVRRGNDGNLWQSRRDASGSCRWRKL